jgi:hypothetical protein
MVFLVEFPISQHVFRINFEVPRCKSTSKLCRREATDTHFVSLPFLGLHQSSISPDRGEEWQERTVFVIHFNWLVNLLFDLFQFAANGKKENDQKAGRVVGGRSSAVLVTLPPWNLPSPSVKIFLAIEFLCVFLKFS